MTSFTEPLTINKVENYMDPDEGTRIREVARMEGKTRSGHTTVSFRDKLLLMIGGASDGIFGERIHKSAYKFNLKTREISRLPELNQARCGAASCELDG